MFMQRQEITSDLPDLVTAAIEAAGGLEPGLPAAGSSGMPLELAAARIERAAGVRLFPERAQLAARIRSGAVTDADLAEAIARINVPGLSIADVRRALDQEPAGPRAMPTVSDLATEATGIDWSAMISDRIAAWSESHFSEQDALCAELGKDDVWASWLDWATNDLTPEILGLDGFVELVNRTDRDPFAVLGDACRALEIDPRAAPSVFERLLSDMWAWAEPLRARLGQETTRRNSPDMMAQLLAIRLTWEQALLEQIGDQIRDKWAAGLSAHRQPVVPNRDHLIDTVLHGALARASARRLDGHLRVIAPVARETASVQLVFTADARSERFRRTVEEIVPDIHTLGVGDSFGLPSDCAFVYRDSAEPGAANLPAVIPDRQTGTTWLSRTIGRMSHALVPGFTLVQASGLLRIGSLINRSLGEQFTVIRFGRTPRLDVAPDSVDAADIAEQALRGIGLTHTIAPLVVFVARQSRTWMAPCSNDGQSTLSARALAQLLNEKPVREALAQRGFAIDPKCVFMAAAHDTISDTVNLFMSDPVGDRYPQSVRRLRRTLERSGSIVRAERALDMHGVENPEDLIYRGGDWAVTAPEAEATSCRWFVIGPRRLTAGANLAGSAALHEYDADADPDGEILVDILEREVLQTALGLRTDYMSTFAPGHFDANTADDAARHWAALDPSSLADATPFSQCDGPTPIGCLVVRVATSLHRLETALAMVPDLVCLQQTGWVDIAALERDGVSNSRPGPSAS